MVVCCMCDCMCDCMHVHMCCVICVHTCMHVCACMCICMHCISMCVSVMCVGVGVYKRRNCLWQEAKRLIAKSSTSDHLISLDGRKGKVLMNFRIIIDVYFFLCRYHHWDRCFKAAPKVKRQANQKCSDIATEKLNEHDFVSPCIVILYCCSDYK